MLKKFNEKHSRTLFVILHILAVAVFSACDAFYIKLYSPYDGYVDFSLVIVPLVTIPILLALRCRRLVATIAISTLVLVMAAASIAGGLFLYWLTTWAGGWK